MPYKFTFFFNLGAQGFSETWYYTGAITDFTPSGVGAQFKGFVAARTALCDTDVNNVGYRISDVVNSRQSVLVVNAFGAAGGGAPDYTAASWLGIAKGANGVGIRQFWMRGIPDEWIKWDAGASTWLPVAGLQAPFANFSGMLKQQPWALRTVNKGGVKNGATPVTEIANGAGGIGTILTANLAATPQQNIIVGGFRFPLQHLNGTYIGGTGWASTAGGGFALFNRIVSANAVATYTGGGSVRLQNFSYTPIVTVGLEFARERRVGRAFFVPRGRRSAK